MKMPIPDDWDGESWLCVSVDWPDSVQYRGILQGLLWLLAKGRYWDERTGVVIDAQEIGREIWARNMPLRLCNGEIIPDDSGNNNQCGGFSDGLSDEEIEDILMSAITKIAWGRDGKLYVYYGECCAKPVTYEDDCTTSPTVDEIGGDGDVIPEDELDDITPPSGASFACLKATALVKTFEDLLLAGQQVVGMVNAYEWDGYLQSQLPYLSLTNWECAKLGIAFQALERLVPMSELNWTAEDTENAICRLAPRMNNDSFAMTSAEFDSYYAIVSSVGDVVHTAQYLALSHMIDKSQYRRAISKHIFDAEADCSCPEVVVPGGALYFTGYINDFPEYYQTVSVTYGTNRQSMTVTLKKLTSGSFSAHRHRILLAQESPLTAFKLVITGNGQPTIDWSTNPADLADPSKHKLPFSSDGVFNPAFVSADQNYGDWNFWTTPAGLFPTVQTFNAQNEWRFTPHNAAANTTFTFTLTLSDFQNQE